MKRRIKTDLIVVHCAATTPDMNIGVKTIDQWHKQRGWECIGYHYVIRRNGEIETGRPQPMIGAHALGYNAHSVGVCLVGGIDKHGKPEDNFTPEQKVALSNFLRVMEGTYPHSRVAGHHTLNKDKACPSFDVETWWEQVNGKTYSK